jgi:16S rRNA (adenine1518-N6/adenine1519-N6)-dimethyltransferase
MMVLMVQKEVADRIVAKPGKMSLLSVSVQFYSQPEIISYVGKENFWPAPDIDSALIKLRIENSPASTSEAGQAKLKIFSGVDKERDFFRLVKFGFSSKRKMLKNNLAGGYKISQELAENKVKRAGFDPKIRAQELAVEDWIKLFGEFD